MRILAMDTTAARGSLALMVGEELVEEAGIEAREGFASVVYQAISELLNRHGLSVSDVDLFAAASGPGSFTGVRIGLSVVKGLAATLGKSAAGVSNLQALAAMGTGELRAAVIDARRNEAYAALYDAELRAVVPEQVGRFERFLELLPEEGAEFLSPDFGLFREALERSRFAGCPVRDGLVNVAAAVGRIAYRQGPAPIAAIDANYVRRSDAELFWKD